MATLTINASGTEGVNFPTYIAETFAAFSAASMQYYAGEGTAAYGSTYTVSGDQVLAQLTDAESGQVSTTGVLLEGNDFAYDFMVYGASYGHGISGALDSLTFGDWTEDTTGTQGTGEAGAITGYGAAVTIDGFALTAEPGSGSDVTTNAVQAVYTAVRMLDAAALTDIIAGYAVDITGSAGADTLDGFGFADVLTGGAGDDLLLNSLGNDTLQGDEGNDSLQGGNGADSLLGGAGDDSLLGQGNADRLSGGAGNDTLTGGHGTDRLTGDAGADLFVFTANTGRDIVTDFTLGEDLLDVSALGVDAASDFVLTQQANGVTLTHDSVTIRLLGLEAADVTDSLFVF